MSQGMGIGSVCIGEGLFLVELLLVSKTGANLILKFVRYASYMTGDTL